MTMHAPEEARVRLVLSSWVFPMNLLLLPEAPDLPPELANAPFDDEPETPEEAAKVADALAAVARGETMTTEELLRSLGL